MVSCPPLRLTQGHALKRPVGHLRYHSCASNSTRLWLNSQAGLPLPGPAAAPPPPLTQAGRWFLTTARSPVAGHRVMLILLALLLPISAALGSLQAFVAVLVPL